MRVAEAFKRNFDDLDQRLGSGVPEAELKLAWEYYGGLVTAIKQVLATISTRREEVREDSELSNLEAVCEKARAATTTASIQAQS